MIIQLLINYQPYESASSCLAEIISFSADLRARALILPPKGRT